LRPYPPTPQAPPATARVAGSMPLTWRIFCLAAGFVASGSAIRHISTPPDPATSTRKCNTEATNGTRYLVDNSKLQANTRGLSYRLSKNNKDRDPRTVAMWDSQVRGIDQGDGWLKVGDCFLPLMLKDVPVLAPLVPGAVAELSWRAPAARLPVEGSEQVQVNGSAGEEQLKAALAEATDVKKAVAASLKASEARAGELAAELGRAREQARGNQTRLAAQEAKNNELSLQLSKLSDEKAAAVSAANELRAKLAKSRACDEQAERSRAAHGTAGAGIGAAVVAGLCVVGLVA